VPQAPRPWWVVASHLDSVRNGGRFDGALGVAAGFAIARVSPVPVAVVSFADEEGARFNTPTFGSKALTGALDPAVLDRTDDDGVTVRAAMAAFGVDPDEVLTAPEWLSRVRGVIELHLDQTPELAHAGRPAGVVSGLAARTRLRVDVSGRADHAGTTRRAERADALAAAARIIVAALDAGPDDPDLVRTASRILVSPNATTTIPSAASVWLDARARSEQPLGEWREAVAREVAAIARAGGVSAALTVASASPAVAFDDRVRAALHAGSAALGTDAPELLCFAGHDAGILAPHVPAGMVLVRNPTGVSHSPDEAVDLADAAFAANVVVEALARLG